MQIKIMKTGPANNMDDYYFEIGIVVQIRLLRWCKLDFKMLKYQ